MAVHEIGARAPARARKPEWSFYLSWVLFTTLCVPMAFLLDVAVLRIVVDFVGDVIYVNGVRRITEDFLGAYIFVPIVGLLTGLLQYVLLRRYLPRVGSWVLATLGGWLLGVFLIVMPGQLGGPEMFLTNLDLIFLIMGLSIGFAQWLLLRQRLSRAGWWIAANALGWGLLGLVTPGSSIAQLGLVLMGFLPACATAAALAFLMNELIPATE